MSSSHTKSSHDGMSSQAGNRLSHADLLKLKRWNTPTIYNGWEQITKSDIAADAFNIEEPMTSCRRWGRWSATR